jgi:hypothetical protein
VPLRRLTALALAAAALLVAALAGAGSASASSNQESIFQDDRLLLDSGPIVQRRTLDLLQVLGVDAIRTTVTWRWLSPTPDSRAAPEGFDAANPASYRSGTWDAYDRLVRRAQARGLGVLMSPAGPVPDWASGCGRNVNFACRPDPEKYGQFVRALATRYSGSYVPEGGGEPLPRVSRWSMWNEPNLGSWLYPQTRRSGRKRIPVGAAWYRRLVYSGTSALRGTGHGSDQILLGETAPIGGAPKNTSPTDFLRQLLCLSGRGKPLRGAAAKRQQCTRARRVRVSGIAHHPYARGAGAPLSRRQRRGSITSGTLKRLLPIIRAARRSRVVKRSLPVYLTEFGVSTKPPDRRFGVALSRQAEFLNRADYIAFRLPWVKSVAQFQLHDDAGLAERGSFQTGLMFDDGRAKPSLHAYRLPLVVTRSGRRLTVFGQARPMRSGRTRIAIQNDPPGRRSWRTVARKSTSRRGYLVTRLRARRGAWRLQWTEPGGAVSYSRVSGGRSSFPAVPAFTPAEPQHVLTVQFQREDSLLFGPAGGRVTSTPGGIDCDGFAGCSASYVEGTDVTLTAVPAPGTTFDGWTGGGCFGFDPCTVPSMMEARTVTAKFRRTGLN